MSQSKHADFFQQVPWTIHDDDRIPPVDGLAAPEPTEFQQLAVATAMLHMFAEPYFNICTLRSAAGALGLQRRLDGPDFEALNALHCVGWGAMALGLPTMVREKCLEILALPPCTLDAVQEAKNAAASSTATGGDAAGSRLAKWKWLRLAFNRAPRPGEPPPA